MSAVLGHADRVDAGNPRQRTGDAGWGTFFSYHGVWAPGVRLFRRLRFSAKAGLISLAFLVPLVLLGWIYFQDQASKLLVVRTEMAGVRALGPINVLNDTLQRQRRVVFSGTVDRPDLALLEQQLGAVRQALLDNAGELGVLGIERLTQAQASLAQMAARPELPVAEEQFATYLDALDTVARDVLDASTLSLDPDVDTYYLMLAGTDLTVQVLDKLSHLRALAAGAAHHGLDDPEINHQIYAMWAFAKEHQAEINDAVQRAATVDATLPGSLKLVERLQAVEKFNTLARSEWLARPPQPVTESALASSQPGLDALRALRDDLHAELAARLAAREARVAQHRKGVIAVMTLCIGLACYLFYSFAIVMHGGLREVRRHLKAMTDGDLTTTPQPWGQDEAARLMVTLAEMQQALRAIVMQVRRGSDHIVHSSSEIASGALDLSARTEQTASNLEESAASMEQISSTVKATADHAREASSIARDNAEVARRGGEVMSTMVTTMNDIHRSSSKINDIIGVIDGIAFQTNILALNAAVEAARAGDAGRGFAVVASEVRSLAQRSAGAAREIKSLITESVGRIESGSNVVRDAGDTIAEIVAGAQRMNQLLGEIATGAQEQSSGVSQIGTAVQDLDRLTQQNAALVEQTAAAADVLKEKAHVLSHQVGRFQLPEGLLVADGVEDTRPVTDFNFDAAIAAHREWKVRLRSAIADHHKLDSDQICKDDQCPLGKWLHGAGGHQWGHKPGFVALVGKHAEFHRAAGDVARRINAGDYAEAERLIGSGSTFATVSSEVSTLLTRAKRGL